MKELGEVTLTGHWDVVVNPLEVADPVTVECEGVRRLYRVTAVERAQDEEGNDIIRVTMEPK